VPTAEEPFTCTTCHVPLHRYDVEPANLMRVNSASPCLLITDTPAGNGFCYKCHGTESTLTAGDMTVFESSGHRSVPAPPTGANITCDTCHESHSSRNTRLLKYEGYMVCVQCHATSASNPDQIDIYGRLTLNDGANTKHPLLPQDQVTGARMTCQNCHNTHTTTKDFPLVDPHNPGPTGTWPNPRSDEKAFCFRCHDGEALPVSAETTPWADPVLARTAATTTTDIKTLYSVNVHGFGSRSAATTTTEFLRPDMGYTYGDVLECRACHDPHGTANGDAVRNDIVSASGDKVVQGVLTAKVAGGVKDFRFFCTVTFPTNCKACHSHASGGVPGGGF
jgi:predicted CXXCH cytochrome family protein